MRKRLVMILGIVLATCLFFANFCSAAYKLDKEMLVSELSQAGYKVIGMDYYGNVPCLRIVLPMKQAIFQVCRRVPSLNLHYIEAREAIANANGLHAFYIHSEEGRPFDTTREIILIPLDTFIQPKFFPEFDRGICQYEKFIIVDRSRQLLAYYEEGCLKACFPVSTGRSGKGTPAMEGWITLKDKEHISSIYDVHMPFSLHLAGPYFLHAGVMPGVPDSAGCIRLFTQNAEWLFQRIGKAKVRFKVG